jgi:uncharacterized protein (DUF58 family)
MPELLSPSFLATLDRLTLVSRRARAGKFKGERRSPRRGGSVEFADFREYAPGDDFRQIDWNAYARLERLFLRLFVEEEDATVHVIVDVSRSMDWGQPLKSTYAVRVAAALGYIALVGMDRLIGAAFGLDGRSYALFPPHRGKHQALAWFDWLAGLAPLSLPPSERGEPEGGQASPLAALTQYAASVRRAGPLIVISDLMDDGWREGIQRLAARHYEITLLHILAPQEIDPEWEGDLKLVDSETNAAVEITADFDLLSRYRARLEAWQSEWQQFCAVRAINYVPIETSLPFEELVLSFLRRRRILK